MNESAQHPTSAAIYQTIFETWRSQVDSYWQRNNYFGAFEIAILAGCWYLIDHAHARMGLFGTVLGFVLAVVWRRSNSTTQLNVDYWWKSIQKIEKQFSLKDDGFDFASLHPGNQSRVGRENWIQYVPVLFMTAWFFMILYYAWHLFAHLIISAK